MAKLVGISYKDKEKKNLSCQELELREEFFSAKDRERQISLITAEAENRLVEDPQRGFCHLKFKGNLIIEDLEISEISKHQRIKIGETLLQITIIGKECHDNCPLSRLETCDIHRSIIFARILKAGLVEVGSYVELEK